MKTVRFIRLLLASLVSAGPVATQAAPAEPLPLPPVPPPRTANARPGVAAFPAPRANPQTATNRPPATPVTNLQPGKSGVFVFDAVSKHVDLTEGERTAAFVFAVTNISSEPTTISYINTSCGCTAGKLPSYPWVLQPGEGGHIDVTMDVTGKYGLVTKTATVVASTGSYPLTVSVSIPAPAPTAMSRSRNEQIAKADRQAVFRNDCASCHVQPAIGKTGKELYDTACAICHEAEHRASMVPDLRARLKNTDRNYWTKWISDGRNGSLMPAFLAKNGGILNEDQIASLVEYLEGVYKKNPPPAKAPTVQASVTPAPTIVKPAALPDR